MSATALSALRGSPLLRLAAGAFALALLVALLPVAALVRLGSGSGAGAEAPAGVPVEYVPLYRAAARAFGVNWLLLAAIHAQETDFSRLQIRGIRGDGVSSGWNGCGAAGPMQFGIVDVAPYGATAPDCGALTGTGAGATWARYRQARNLIPAAERPARYPLMRGRVSGCARVPPQEGCVYDDLDAIAAAAAALHDLGAREELDDDAWQAARRYNGSPAYADAVLARARAWQAVARDDLASFDPTLADVPGEHAQLGADGRARAPRDAPPAIARAIAAANAISDRPYLLRHYPTHLNNPTYDCSSASSHVLWGAGVFGTAPWTSGQFTSWGEPGPGRWITVYARAEHMFLLVSGLRFDTAQYDTGPNQHESGPRWRLGPRPTDGFTIRHPSGL